MRSRQILAGFSVCVIIELATSKIEIMKIKLLKIAFVEKGVKLAKI